MFYEPDKNDHGLPYNPFKACVVPRPIGWISSISEDGLVNLAPFSFFNALSYDPPFVCFSIGSHSEDGEPKDTVVNIEATGEFVYNMATWDQRDQMNNTGLIVDRTVNELDAAGLEAVPSKFVKPPRVKGSPVHFECKHFQTVILPGNVPSSIHHLIIGQVIGVHIDDDMITGEGLLDTLKMRPIARLGYKDYTSVDSVFQMEKLTSEELIGKPQAAE
jgi:flavin reductase (DIM6/NTAB) family NADH-FMN oxidoreductase RutF